MPPRYGLTANFVASRKWLMHNSQTFTVNTPAATRLMNTWFVTLWADNPPPLRGGGASLCSPLAAARLGFRYARHSLRPLWHAGAAIVTFIESLAPLHPSRASAAGSQCYAPPPRSGAAVYKCELSRSHL